MQAQNTTNNRLLTWHNEIQSLNGSIVAKFLHSKIREFYNNNGVRINSLQDKRSELTKKYFVIEDDKLKTEGDGENAKPVLIEGKTNEDFENELKELMEKEVAVYL